MLGCCGDGLSGGTGLILGLGLACCLGGSILASPDASSKDGLSGGTGLILGLGLSD